MSEYDLHRWGCGERTLHLKGRVDIKIGHGDGQGEWVTEGGWGRVVISCDGKPCIEMECTDPSSIMWRLIKNEGL